ncbi:hypothetical protein [Pontixanthobacter aquaemixtae]|uniref:Uncharacterized protein n=1 Tax=Pontixanthobacter aquaemixtae TaxID=1958940 RepID=A0A844ZWM2_9SPHN|nr:hypothetical protein [Pontixanthobacter aquaemixtae]MXO91580.1 hypothetical protein [Pontixanthobacter aquaemixtae]
MFTSKKSASAKQGPISAHPLFPAVVAIWFAALLGLGSLVIPVAVFERLFAATGLASMVAAFQAPIGTTTRIAIALFAAIAGAGAGLFIARKVISAQAASQPAPVVAGRNQANSDHGVKPISAHEELGAEGLDEPVAKMPENGPAYSGRRRALAVTDDSGPSDYFESAPLPGGEPAMDLPEDEQPEEAEPFELLELATEEPDAEDQHAGTFEDIQAQLGNTATYASETDIPEHSIRQAADERVAALRKELGTMTDQPESPAQFGQPPFAAPVAAPAEEPVATAPVEPAIPVAPFAEPQAAVAEEFQETIHHDVAPSQTPESTGSKGLHELGMVELVDRFALALQRKAEAKAEIEATAQAAAEQESTPLVFRRAATEEAAAPFAPSEPHEAGAAVAEFFGTSPSPAQPAAPAAEAEPAPPVPVIPAALRPLGLDEDEDEDDGEAPSLSLSFAMSQNAPAPSAEPTYGASEEPAETFAAAEADEQGEHSESNSDGDEYSSLLAMKSPFASGQEFVRVDEVEENDGSVEPAVIFPGSEQRAVPASDGPSRDPIQEAQADHAPAPRPFDAPGTAPANGTAHDPSATSPKPNSGETERALREALEKLQRMSGAA